MSRNEELQVTDENLRLNLTVDIKDVKGSIPTNNLCCPSDSVSCVVIEHSMSNENYIDLDEIPPQEDVTKFSLIIL